MVGVLLAAVAALAADAAADCGECHERVWTQWRGSRHAESASNPVFRASWEHWPNGWCLTCHAPDPAQQLALTGAVAVPGEFRPPLSEPDGERWRDGVDCAACHVRDARILTATTPTELAEAMHPMTVAPALATEQACASCHEFAMQLHTPAQPFTLGDTPAQATLTEWASSTAAAEGVVCQDCHMGEHGHAFPGAHAPALVREALHADVVTLSDGRVRATIRAPGAAHRIPTGDPFRRLVLDVCGDRACEPVLASTILRRVFETTETTWVPYADRTVPPERPGAPAERVVDLAPPSPARWWRLTYFFGDPRFEHKLPPEEIGYPVAEGPVTEEAP